MIVCMGVFFVKQKTADEMRIMDWISDVCSSDLTAKMFTARMRVVSDHRPDHFNERSSLFFGESVADAIERFDCLEALVDGAELLAKPLDMAVDGEIGSASCGERVCQYV